MQGWNDTAHIIFQILSNPAWGGVGVIISSILSIIAILLARRSKVSSPQEPQNLLMPADDIECFMGGSYRRKTIAKEFVNDIDIFVALKS